MHGDVFFGFLFFRPGSQSVGGGALWDDRFVAADFHIGVVKADLLSVVDIPLQSRRATFPDGERIGLESEYVGRAADLNPQLLFDQRYAVP